MLPSLIVILLSPQNLHFVYRSLCRYSIQMHQIIYYVFWFLHNSRINIEFVIIIQIYLANNKFNMHICVAIVRYCAWLYAYSPAIERLFTRNWTLIFFGFIALALG